MFKMLDLRSGPFGPPGMELRSAQMSDFYVTARPKFADTTEYARLLDMLEVEHALAPVNPGDTPRVYLVDAPTSELASRQIPALLDQMGYASVWPNQIAEFAASVV